MAKTSTSSFVRFPHPIMDLRSENGPNYQPTGYHWATVHGSLATNYNYCNLMILKVRNITYTTRRATSSTTVHVILLHYHIRHHVILYSPANCNYTLQLQYALSMSFLQPPLAASTATAGASIHSSWQQYRTSWGTSWILSRALTWSSVSMDGDSPPWRQNIYKYNQIWPKKIETRRALGGAHVPLTKAKIQKLGKFDAP